MMKSVFTALGLDADEIMQRAKDFFDHVKGLTIMIRENNIMLKEICDFWKIDYELIIMKAKEEDEDAV